MAQLANKIMEVAMPLPAIAAVSTTFELKHLRKEIAEFKSLLKTPQSSKDLVLAISQPTSAMYCKSSVCTITSMVIMHNPMQKVRKIPGYALKAMDVAGLSHSHLLYISYRHNV